MTPQIARRRLTFLLGLLLLSACTGVETGAVSPCHGQFRAEGKYFAARQTADGSHVDFHPDLTRVFHRELTRLKVMFCGLCWGQDMRGLPFRFGYC